MAGKIFINYRRGDDPGFAQALYQRLKQDFPPRDLFMDVEGHIKGGDDFEVVLNRQVAECDVLLALIGPRWADLMTARAGDADDFVAIEIKAALDQGKRVIPVLVNGAAMPRADALPDPIRLLVRRHAVGVRHERFEADCQGLVNTLKEALAAAERERAARTEAERDAVEADRRTHSEGAARTAAEERVRAQPMPRKPASADLHIARATQGQARVAREMHVAGLKAPSILVFAISLLLLVPALFLGSFWLLFAALLMLVAGVLIRGL